MASTLSLKLETWNKKRTTWLLIGSIIVVMGLHFLTLTVYPPVFIDEGWLANRSWNWLQTGIFFESMHTGVLDQFGHEWVTNNILGQLPYLIMYRILGVGLFQTRFVTWLFSVALLFLVVQVGRRLYDLNTGLVAALFLSLSIPFLESSRIRQDIILTAFILLSFWFALYALKQDKLWAHFLAGLVLALGFDVHQTAIIFVPALAALYIAYYGRSVVFKRGTWVVGFGSALGLAYYAVSHMLPNYEVYTKLMSFYFVSEADARVPLLNPELIPESIVREFARYRFRTNLLDLILITLGGILLLRRRSKSDLLMLVYTGSAFISFTLISSNKTFLYAIHLYPFFMLIIAAGLLSLVQNQRQKRIVLAAALSIVVFLGYGLYQTASRISTNRDYNYYAITNRIREVIPEDRRVLGMPTWWFGFTDYDYRSSLSIPYYRFFNEYDVKQALEAIKPDYIIVDSTQLAVLADEGQTLVQGMNVYRVSRQEFISFLETQTERVLQFSDNWHGEFLIYKVRWDG